MEKVVEKAVEEVVAPKPAPVVEAPKAAPAPQVAPAPKREVAKIPPFISKAGLEGINQRPVGAPQERGPVDDFRRPKVIRKGAAPARPVSTTPSAPRREHPPRTGERRPSTPTTTRPKPATTTTTPKTTDKEPAKKGVFKEYRDVSAQRKPAPKQSFDTRDRMGLRDSEDGRWRKKRMPKKGERMNEELTIRPKTLHVRIPITVKDLASSMKVKSSELISKLFLQGVALTINDHLNDETTIQLLGHEFGCEITIDTSEETRINITDKTIKEEIASADPEQLRPRPPVITFMGHVDHGKTSLIDAIRKSDIAAGEAGAITQHIGAFKCHSEVGEITILDTPGHEAFASMRERGAEVTDLVVLVIAGDEGIRDQTLEAMNQAKEAKVPILVAINKCDKPGFNAENVYRQLAEQELLPEAWGGSTITVNCSALTGVGVKELLEMLALQSDVLELKANPLARARGSVIESAMHKGLGAVVTLLVQNGTLKVGDALVFDRCFARVKTMYDEHGKELQVAGPATPVKITGLSDLPEAGSEFVAVANEKEARDIAEVRSEALKHKQQQKVKRAGLEGFLEKNVAAQEKKVFNVLLKADVQGSLEALKQSLQKIQSDKVTLNIISEGVGQIAESDVALAAASGATIIGFHTKVESHADYLIKEKKVTIKLHDIIYHAVDDVKEMMRNLLDKIPQENDMGKAEVRAVFKSSHVGLIAGCIVLDGIIKRNHHIRLKRDGQLIWKGTVASLKRVKEDVREVSKGIECGILLQGHTDVRIGDIIESYEITYLEQDL